MNLQETDFYRWTQETAHALRTGHYAEVDMQSVAEELEKMGASERRELINRLAVLLMHLLKWQYQPGIRSRSWELTLIEQRREIQDLLEDNPSLKPQLQVKLDKAYSKAILKAEKETNLPARTFPVQCPYPLEQILQEDFYPD
ncbi:DUF29 domain-containing protein [Candidatus Venteria ishoeyi]|uniref:DUF29 domain-containing protein n=1 Tax=Candidatus Venteria ishoeyi TaxID=1899563 RepID=UPI0025A5E2F3|nr:DUF29 domain-containing protein [Candidatus Venteria ishoeyi]MDM8547008.1 DUF29 domain-containing protein [Candidatus Venteria ishoeyi]